MTQFASMCEWLDDAGVVYETKVGERASAEILVRQGAGPKNVGYGYFYTALEFNDKGQLQKWGTWE